MKHTPNILMVAVFAVFATAMYLLFFEKPWLSYRNNPFAPLKAQVRAGEVAKLHVIRCNSSGHRRSYRFEHSLTREDNPGSFPVVLPTTVVFIDPGCQEADSEANVVPKDTPPGVYRVTGLSEIQMTLGTSFVEWSSKPFEVLP